MSTAAITKLADGLYYIELPHTERAEAPYGHVVVADGLDTFHRPYEYSSRWMDGRGGFKPTPQCTVRTWNTREWILILEEEAEDNGYDACLRCWR